MLNLSHNRIEGKIDTESYHSFSMVRDYRAARLFTRLVVISFAIFLVVIFLPWTQNIRSKGYVTTLQPDQRPQTINSIIAGRIETWYVREGDYVQKGDTILFISEIKDEYFDPDLLSRTEQQIKAKEMTVSSYMEKVKALDQQIDALNNTRRLKIEQARNYITQAELKIVSDSIKVQDANNDYNIAVKQLDRMEQLYADGLKSLTDLERKKAEVQETLAKMIGAENDLLTSRNKLINTRVELSSVDNQYRNKLSKAESEKYTALSKLYDSEALVTKMQNQFMNYSVRAGFYYITAPQNGYITTALRSGLGETVKEGEELVSIMPSVYDLAVSMYIRPMDLPLVKIGQPVRFMFDGWPTIVFSGWPNLSFGTFGGEVVAIDNFISKNGKYRILVAPNPDEEWPDGLRVGSGANGLALLKDVPIWYELWRNLNGFPPDYYIAETDSTFQTSQK
jgi:multidrug resistance efflux pump